MYIQLDKNSPLTTTSIGQFSTSGFARGAANTGVLAIIPSLLLT